MTQDSYRTSLHEIAVQFSGKELINFKQAGGGRNSRVYKIDCMDENSYIVKFYFLHPNDPRRRLENEFSAFQFLWQNGFRNIPQPLTANKAQGYAIYEHIEGEKITSSDVSEADIGQLVQFLSSLKELKSAKGSEAFSLASEAFFSIDGIVSNLNNRLDRLQDEAKGHSILRDFLEKEFSPFLKEVIDTSHSKVQEGGLSWQGELGNEKRTLSPSDFGFHNALRRKNREITYLDFEYFGWDDPAKMISDFLLHPGMNIDEKWKQIFVKKILQNFDQDESLVTRIKLVYPLFGMKWCLILLNEFLPEFLQRRRLAGEYSADKNILEIQMQKTQKMLHKIKNHFQHFPYFE